MATNTAAWLVAKRARLEVNVAPYTRPRENEIVVRNHALAINPIDWIKQVAGNFLFSWIKYPFILGSDPVGEVVEVGNAITRLKVGDRSLGHAVVVDKKRNSAAEGSFQDYTVVLGHMAAPIPDAMSYESACVLPLALSTAACGLFEKDQLALRYPSPGAMSKAKTLLVWAVSTSVSSDAIQLIVAAGYEVITTCSPANFEYVRSLGASRAFDYNRAAVVRDIIAVLKGNTIAGALAIEAGSVDTCLHIVHASKGDKCVSMASFPISFKGMAKGAGAGSEMLRQLPKPILFNLKTQIKSRIRGIRTGLIFGTTLMNNEVKPSHLCRFPNPLHLQTVDISRHVRRSLLEEAWRQSNRRSKPRSKAYRLERSS